MNDKKDYPLLALGELDRVHDLRDSAELIPGHARAEALIERAPWQCEPWRSGGGLGERRFPPLLPFPTRAYCEGLYRAWREAADRFARLGPPGKDARERAEVEAYLWMSAAVINERNGR